jgi:hypothetical protein
MRAFLATIGILFALWGFGAFLNLLCTALLSLSVLMQFGILIFGLSFAVVMIWKAIDSHD